jgi:hypothetical protein
MSWFDDQYQASRLRLVVIVFLTAACAGAAKINELETASSPATMAPAARRPLRDRLARSNVDVVKVVVLVSMQFVPSPDGPFSTQGPHSPARRRTTFVRRDGS